MDLGLSTTYTQCWLSLTVQFIITEDFNYPVNGFNNIVVIQ